MKYLLPLLFLLSCSKSKEDPTPPPYNPRLVTLKVQYQNGGAATIQSVSIDSKSYGPYSGDNTLSIIAPTTSIGATAIGGDGSNYIKIQADNGASASQKISNPGSSTSVIVNNVTVQDTIFVTVYK